MQKTQNEDKQIKTQHSKLKRQITQLRQEYLYEQMREKTSKWGLTHLIIP
jgi:hypothetical protein